MEELTDLKCTPIESDMKPLDESEAAEYLSQTPGWDLVENNTKIIKLFTLGDFKESLDFVNKVGEIAEAERHHPDINISWNKVTLELSTHAISGLSKNDFILAAKINQLDQK